MEINIFFCMWFGRLIFLNAWSRTVVLTSESQIFFDTVQTATVKRKFKVELHFNCSLSCSILPLYSSIINLNRSNEIWFCFHHRFSIFYLTCIQWTHLDIDTDRHSFPIRHNKSSLGLSKRYPICGKRNDKEIEEEKEQFRIKNEIKKFLLLR